jgi:UDP-N-acetylmuramate dehydrogenase
MSHGAPPTIERAVPLAPLTTFEIGGPARYLVRAASAAAVGQALDWARRESVPVLVLGGGSNLLIADQGFDGLVLKIEIDGCAAREMPGEIQLVVGAGVPWDEVVAKAVARGWAGIECLSGIPGSAGAAPIQNIGAYGQELSETLVGVTAVDRRSGESLEIEAADCGFGYRTSRFRASADGRPLVVLQLTLRLVPAAASRPRYAELERELARRGVSGANPADVREAVLCLRAAKSMLARAEDPLRRSAGSFFLNPVVTATERAAMESAGRQSGALGEDEVLPAFESVPGELKIPAAWLIERAGFPRGTRRGRVGISARHALAIVNHGSATAAAVLALAREVRDGVEARFGVRLRPEAVLVGVEWD